MWDKEEFQPVLALFNSLKEEAIMDIRRADITGDSAENIKALAGAIKIKINMTSMLIELPERIKEIEEQQGREKTKLSAMKAAQEGGTV